MPRKATTDTLPRPPSIPSAEAEFGPPSFFAGRRVYLIGIGGCGMSALARLVRAAGGMIEGSDSVPCEFTEALIRDGVLIHTNQIPTNLSRDCDLVIATAAVREDHPEFAAARDLGIPILRYAEALGRLQSEHTGVSIAGTHGKSTTTALLAHVMIECGLDPSLIVGANCPQIGGNARVGATTIPFGPFAGRPGLLLAEACEFNRSFLQHRPVIGLINNVEADHLDIYGSLENVVDAFAQFAERIAPADGGGTLLIGFENPHRQRITRDVRSEVITFGESRAADFVIDHNHADGMTSLVHHAARRAAWRNPMPGAHSAHNAAAAAILAHLCGAEWDGISRAIESFRGVERRMERLGVRRIPGGTSQTAEITVYDDYGHHPTEIRSTLEAIREHEKPQRLICVFQPHQHSRTRFLLEEFAASFNAADIVIVPHIYFVRDGDEEKAKISAADLVDRIRAHGVNAMHVYPFEAVVRVLESMCRAGDLVVNMGAGPVWKVAKAFLAGSEPQMHGVSSA